MTNIAIMHAPVDARLESMLLCGLRVATGIMGGLSAEHQQDEANGMAFCWVDSAPCRLSCER